MIIIISNTIPPIAPTIIETALEPVAVVVTVLVVTVLIMVVVIDGGVVETSDECNEVAVNDTLVIVGGKVVYDEPSGLDTVTVLNNERY